MKNILKTLIGRELNWKWLKQKLKLCLNTYKCLIGTGSKISIINEALYSEINERIK